MLNKGDTIVCTECGVDVAEIQKDIYAGDPMKTSNFIGLIKPVFAGERFICPLCGNELLDRYGRPRKVKNEN